MTMNAAPASLLSLLANPSTRYEIPVYQRPYSWDEEQCEQLWQDILTIGRRPDLRHFTGSVVYVMDGCFNPAGMATSLIIDGQQRMTTVSLLLAALASFARNHHQAKWTFSQAEIIGSNYLVSPFKYGEDHYRLTLSQGDKDVFRALIDAVEHDDLAIPAANERIVANYEFFYQRLENMADPELVWSGMQRLDVVSISLDAGKDNPQLIFESMNSTGKDLSSADLIRNYVLMGLEREQQNHMYLHHWRKIELALGKDSYDKIFDEFVRNYLTVLYAPEPLTRRTVYPLFKRHVIDNGYDKELRIVELLQQMEDFARYYANITMGMENEPRLKRALDNIAQLNAGVVNPVLLCLYDDHARGAFATEDFIAMVELLESYILRRAVVDAPTNSLNKFFLTLISKLHRARNENIEYRVVFEQCLLAEDGSSRRFPSDREFENALLTRDAYHFRRCFYLLKELERTYHPKDTWTLDSKAYTIEHVMPQNARAHEEWLAVLDNEQLDAFESICNNLGNLTLTAYNAELSDGSFKEKKERIVGGYDTECLVISKTIQSADIWTPELIEELARLLAKKALKRWPYLSEAGKTAIAHASSTSKEEKTQKSKVTLPMLLKRGLVQAGTMLTYSSSKLETTATITESGHIRLENGEEFASPSKAAGRALKLHGFQSSSRNGWDFWRISGGPLLNDLRKQFLAAGRS